MSVRLYSGQGLEAWCGDLSNHSSHGICPGAPFQVHYDLPEERELSQKIILEKWIEHNGIKLLGPR